MGDSDGVRWLLVGTGDIARKRVAPALASCAGSRLVGACDIARDRAAALAGELDVGEVYTDLHEALSATSADAVYLATPVSLHAPQAVQVLESGKHVLVEKPLGLTAADASPAVEAAERARMQGLKAGCAYFRRLTPRYLQAKHMLDSEEFGQVVLVRMTFFSWFNPDREDPKFWRVVKAKSGGGPLSDMGTHMFDVMIGLLGMPRRVFARLATQTHDYEVEDSAAIIMEYDDGPQVVASFNWNSKTWSHEFEIIGTEAKVKWHPYDGGPVVRTVGRDVQQLDLPSAENVHAPIIEDFNRAVIENGEPTVPLPEAIRTNVLLDAVYQSAEMGVEVTL